MKNEKKDNIICHTQERIYEYMTEKGYDMNVFSREYLSCDFCKRAMDTIYSRFLNEFPNECADFFMPQIESRLKKGELDVYAGDIGYMYRKLYIETSIPSAELAKLIPYEKMRALCRNMNHYGTDYTLDDIIEKYKLPRKRYDSDFVPLTKEEMKQIEEQDAKEKRESEKKYLGR